MRPLSNSDRLYSQYVAEFIQEFLTDLETQIDHKSTGKIQSAVLDLILAVVEFDLSEVRREI